ncbi:MAG: hypothetical protein K0R14_4 [Burkholderiales bacterium]|jgi:GNAT superfamily N-acetyltransferase|nr:hypothetical protein [Burkholderiales bacterium]
MIFTVRAMTYQDIDDLIIFDKIYLIDRMRQIGIKSAKCSSVLSRKELLAALNRNDFLYWLYADNALAGYMWRIKQGNCLFGAGAAIKPEFYGKGLSYFIIDFTEALAKKLGLNICKLMVMPENGRVISAYMKHGYTIVNCISACNGPAFPETFRCILEKNIESNNFDRIILDRQEVLCADEPRLKMLTDKSYVGVEFIKNDEDFTKNKIVCLLLEKNNNIEGDYYGN